MRAEKTCDAPRRDPSEYAARKGLPASETFTLANAQRLCALAAPPPWPNARRLFRWPSREFKSSFAEDSRSPAAALGIAAASLSFPARPGELPLSEAVDASLTTKAADTSPPPETELSFKVAPSEGCLPPCSLAPQTPRRSGEPHLPLELPVLSTTPEGRLPPPLCTPLEGRPQPELSFRLELSSLCALQGGCSLPPLPPRRSAEPHLRLEPLPELELPVPVAPSEGCAPPLLAAAGN